MVDWDKFNETQLSFGSGWGARAVCLKCGARQRVRLQRGDKISLASCCECGEVALQRAKIDEDGNVLNEPKRGELK